MSTTDTTWTDLNVCPFCSAELADPGEGFVDHLKTSTSCESTFDAWRENVAGDVAGGWIA